MRYGGTLRTRDRLLVGLIALWLALAPAGCGFADLPSATSMPTSGPAGTVTVQEGERYDTPREVAAYLHAYGHLPANYLTRSEAIERGWKSSEGNLWDVAYGCSIGGDVFGNREGLLPSANGRTWHECDVNYQGGFRGAERLVYSSDGLVYYSDDHYLTFTRID
jgi:hypothetical protein